MLKIKINVPFEYFQEIEYILKSNNYKFVSSQVDNHLDVRIKDIDGMDNTVLQIINKGIFPLRLLERRLSHTDTIYSIDKRTIL